jgi:prolyl-tRNA synthetase
MGCHGIGVSRLIAAVAACISDKTGLNWPRVIAPFEVVILTNNTANSVEHGDKLYDQLSSSLNGPVDAVVDDREQRLPWKMKDADLIGYPVLIILGKSLAEGKAEVQCRRLRVKETVELGNVVHFVNELLKKL